MDYTEGIALAIVAVAAIVLTRQLFLTKKKKSCCRKGCGISAESEISRKKNAQKAERRSSD